MLTKSAIDKWRQNRWRARNDLVWLCNEVLDYPDVSWRVQGPFINRLQRFPTPENYEQATQHDQFDGKSWSYKPITPMYQLPGGRRVLILDPRSFLKTTSNVIAHTIQWILNYPDVSILVVQSTTSKAYDFLREVKGHFQVNPLFRALFPEHCPQDKVFDFGTQAQFVTKARRSGFVRRESTVTASSIDAGTAGYHFDVMKFSDIVEDSNSRTVEQNQSVIRSFYMMENLLVRPDSWIDVEGTTYHYADLYTDLMESEAKKMVEDRRWSIHVRSCYKRVDPATNSEQKDFYPATLEWPYMLDATKPVPKDAEEPDFRRQSWWPERFPTDVLELRRLHPIQSLTFASQMLNKPKEAVHSPFPWDSKKGYPRIISPEVFKSNVRISYYDVAVDTADTTGARSDYTAMVVGGWSDSGVLYIVEIVRARLDQDQIISEILRLNRKYKPEHVKIEKTSYVRGMEPALRRVIDLRQEYVPVELIPISTQISKEERILRTLSPWYKRKEIVFLADCGNLDEVQDEMTKFPNCRFDDVLDAMSDLFQGKEWFGRETPRRGAKGEVPEEWLKTKFQQAAERAWKRAFDMVDAPARSGVPESLYYRNVTGYS